MSEFNSKFWGGGGATHAMPTFKYLYEHAKYDTGTTKVPYLRT